MTRNLALVFVASILGLLGTNASAQNVVLPAFSGPYIGGAVGFASHHVDITNPISGELKDTNTSGTVGGYLGYNWNYCGLLFGVETDLNYLNSSPTGLDIETGPTGLTETSAYNSKLQWFGTLRGRAGFFVMDNWLLYGTGGLAYGKTKHTLNDNCVGCGNSTFNLGTFSQSNSKTKTGWTLGGGSEYALDPNWLLRAEALFVDLGSENRTYVVVTPAATGILNAKWDDQFWVGRLGLTYAFGAP